MGTLQNLGWAVSFLTSRSKMLEWLTQVTCTMCFCAVLLLGTSAAPKMVAPSWMKKCQAVVVGSQGPPVCPYGLQHRENWRQFHTHHHQNLSMHLSPNWVALSPATEK